MFLSIGLILTVRSTGTTPAPSSFDNIHGDKFFMTHNHYNCFLNIKFAKNKAMNI
jgi:hypothetical protein